MGLCFGGGQIGLGISALILGLGTFWGLKHAESMLRQDVRATLTVVLSKMGPSDEEIRASIAQSTCTIISWGIAYTDQGQRRQVRSEIERRVLPSETRPPSFVSHLAENAHVFGIQWKPQGLAAESESHPSEPKGTPIPISEAK
jgi:putative Mg2+ transporter-C (MgtC) family protein